MKIVNYKNLNKEEKNLLEKAHNTAEKTISGMGHRIGCVIKCWDGKEFLGVTNIRSRTIGSTCAERMALDQMHFYKNKLLHPNLKIVLKMFFQS